MDRVSEQRGHFGYARDSLKNMILIPAVLSLSLAGLPLARRISRFCPPTIVSAQRPQSLPSSPHPLFSLVTGCASARFPLFVFPSRSLSRELVIEKFARRPRARGREYLYRERQRRFRASESKLIAGRKL